MEKEYLKYNTKTLNDQNRYFFSAQQFFPTGVKREVGT
jgi:hypothetical protein